MHNRDKLKDNLNISVKFFGFIEFIKIVRFSTNKYRNTLQTVPLFLLFSVRFIRGLRATGNHFLTAIF